MIPAGPESLQHPGQAQGQDRIGTGRQAREARVKTASPDLGHPAVADDLAQRRQRADSATTMAI